LEAVLDTPTKHDAWEQSPEFHAWIQLLPDLIEMMAQGALAQETARTIERECIERECGVTTIAMASIGRRCRLPLGHDERHVFS
jgi:hypothetical protein